MLEIPQHLVKKWSDLKNCKTTLTPYDLYILANSKHKELAFLILKHKINQRRGQIINYRQEPFLQALQKMNGFTDLHCSNLSLSDIESPEQNVDRSTSTILDDNQIETLKEELLLYFKEEEPYLNPQLSLKIVADVIGLNTNKMSFLINQAFNANFNDFVNSYRLDHFKSIALDPKNSHLTILGLAYDSGFNSKSVFNTYFKKIEDVTPRAWMRANSL